MSTFTEGRHPGEFVLTEANGSRSRESLTIAAEQTIEANSILSSIADPAKVAATAIAGGENSGDATITLAEPAVSTAVKVGRYRGIATSATTVSWEDPHGSFVGESLHGEAFDGPIKFTITAGSTPNVAGDEFVVFVVADIGAFQYLAYDPDENASVAGLAIYRATTGAGETVKIAAIVRDAEVNGHSIAWPAGITDTQKTIAKGALADLGIIVR